MLTLKLTSFFVAVAVLHIASARFALDYSRQKFINELSKNLGIALQTNHGRKNFDAFHNIVLRYEYDCKRHAINKVIQAHARGKDQQIAAIEKYYQQNRYKDFANQAHFKFNAPMEHAAIQAKSTSAAHKIVTLCTNMEAMSAGKNPSMH